MGDGDDHHRVLCKRLTVGNIIYSAAEMPTDLNNGKDIEYAKEHELRMNTSKIQFSSN